jgi:hypothetical protein
MVRRGDHDGIDRFVVEKRSEVADRAAGVEVQLLRGRVAALFVDIADVGEFDIRRVLKQLGIVGAAPATADERDNELVVFLTRGVK